MRFAQYAAAIAWAAAILWSTAATAEPPAASEPGGSTTQPSTTSPSTTTPRTSQTPQTPELRARVVQSTTEAGAAVIHAEVSGVQLVDPAMAMRGQAGQGHLHYRIDGGPVIATPSDKLSLHQLTEGQHRVEVLLAGNDHKPLGPRQTLSFTVGATGARSGAPSGQPPVSSGPPASSGSSTSGGSSGSSGSPAPSQPPASTPPASDPTGQP
jgi:hypothetical protein